MINLFLSRKLALANNLGAGDRARILPLLLVMRQYSRIVQGVPTTSNHFNFIFNVGQFEIG